MSQLLDGQADSGLAAPRPFRVPVAGGELAGGEWGPSAQEAPEAPVVLAVHGITASHRCWPLLPPLLPGVRVIAPDLRGRGRSGGLPGPYGLASHAADMVALLDALGVAQAHVVGHSMGGFVSVALAGTAASRVSSLTLVDGGLPLALPDGVAAPGADATPEDVLGPAAARLSMTFPDREAYRDFWRAHPAFGDWTPVVEGYVDYDLEGTEPHLRTSTNGTAVATDGAQLFGGDAYDAWLASIAVPTTFLRAPRGLLDEPRALYAPGYAETFSDRVAAAHGGLRVVEVEDVNHYTIVMAEDGARRVAEEVLPAVRSR
ncbi:alpha/beta fold hydrolase [Nocardioides bruguierae]|uniref:alpha/beta fold hydrolase n=1 Tax=Nocardioides bruguierae TaxID=2945102 RepID=UPI002022683B|nr:alpha/beta hydrolase [Nocardioides bruguierae]MCL8025905.1 alpha/beta hydrolase [Nocardioides bruguierae]